MNFMKVLFFLIFLSIIFVPAFAQTNSQTLPTSKGTLDVKVSYDDIVPGQLTTLQTDFINPQTKKIQEHIDWRFSVSKDGDIVWGPTQLSHTSEGSLRNLKYDFEEEGTYTLEYGIEGILFQPIPLETVSFEIVVGDASAQPDNSSPDNSPSETTSTENEKGGGCLIATAAYGSELAPQVQQLRELRDNTILKTESGKSFMSLFNEFYYSFSPGVADLERENPIFKESVKLALTPMVTSLSLLNYVDVDSEPEMLGYGISLILLNVGMYVGIPAFAVLHLYQHKKIKI
jgi:hypothetical protein